MLVSSVQWQIRRADAALETSLKAAESSLSKGGVQVIAVRMQPCRISQTYTLSYQLSVDMVPQILTRPTALDNQPSQFFTPCQWILRIYLPTSESVVRLVQLPSQLTKDLSV